ncbi:hypothetical protein SAMN05216359_102368 [Roseateles sp. YR242]|nr:hypothetical protein SAMN05216359_102368 [Roseateles sp. YR242]
MLIKLGPILALSLACASVSAAPQAFSCPAQLPQTQQKLGEVPAGFTVGQETPKHTLVAFRINEGPLDARAGAIYDDVKTKRDAKGTVTETVLWNLPTTPGAIAICGYYATSVVLTHALEGYKQCTMVSRKLRDGVFEIQSASCR